MTDKRKQILAAALKVFAKYGFEKATIKQIAREAGLSTTSLLYWYFKNKNELLLSVLNQESPIINLASNPAELMTRPIEEVLPIIARTFLDTYDNPDMVKVMRIFLAEALKNEQMGTRFANTGLMTVLDFLVKYLNHQVKLGKLKQLDCQSAVRSFIGTLVIYILGREIFPPLRADLPEKEQYIREVTTIFIRGLDTK
jgi:AcrR family transcriptional regulator